MCVCVFKTSESALSLYISKKFHYRKLHLLSFTVSQVFLFDLCYFKYCGGKNISRRTRLGNFRSNENLWFK